MLQPLLDKIGRAALTSGADGASCPRCEGEGRSTGQTYTCSSCGFIGAPMEWFRSSLSSEPTGKVDSPPPGTQIKKKEPSPGATAFEIPASGRSGGLLFFAIFWLAITAPLSFAFLFGGADFSSGDIPEQYQWLIPIGLVLFFSIFWAVGLGMLYAGLKGKFSKHLLLAKDHTLVHVRELFHKKKTTSFRFSEISSIAAIEFYQSNYEPVYGVEIRNATKKIRFGSTLTDEEKGWLVAELNALVFPSREEARTLSRAPLGRPAPRGPFEVFVPYQKMKGSEWVGTVVGLLISGGFVALGLSPLMADEPFFRTIWIGFSSLFFLAIIGGTIWQISRRSVSKSVFFDGTTLSLRQSRHTRRTQDKKILPLADLHRVALYPIGGSNGEARYTASLITETQVLPLFRWKPRELAEDFVQELQQELNYPQETFQE